MRVLITGAAGNLGSFTARAMLAGPHSLRLMVHRRPLAPDLARAPNVAVYHGDLSTPQTLAEACRDVEVIVHFAGRLFAPRPERFLPQTNVQYVQHLVAAALHAGVRKFILISFPHVDGESTPQHPATGRLDGRPASVHAQTRLAAERYLFTECGGTSLVPLSLRAGMIYGGGVLMIEAGRRLLRRRLLPVWPQPTWIHLLALPDFLACVLAAVEDAHVTGIYNLGDDQPMTLQQLLDRLAGHWGYPRPWRLPRWSFYAAASAVEVFAAVFRTAAPLTRDFIRIGMASYVMDTTRMKRELRPRLAYPTLTEGLALLQSAGRGLTLR